MSRARRVRGGAIAKESVRGTAWPDDDRANDEETPVCPNCGGQLVPVDDFSDLLSPKLICVSCRAVWPDLNTLPHEISAAVIGRRFPRVRRANGQVDRQREWMLWLTVASGLIVLLTMVMSWIQFERGVCAGCDFGQWRDWDDLAESNAKRMRIVIPAVSLYWLWLLRELVRNSETTNRGAIGFLIWVLVAIVGCVIV